MTDKELLEYCNEYLIYDAESGILTWKKRVSNRSSRVIGSEAGSIGSKGYKRITFSWGEESYHRISFGMYHGYIPEIVDHKDRDPLNNRITNLRAATHSENQRNMKPTIRNKSGYKGVSWNKKNKIWQATIQYDKKNRNLGSFKCKHEAARVYNLAALMNHGEFAYINMISSENDL
tara:strand:- start:3100 stop:3627 length:528 start_codon:yes stop_codon:yes gene_type:complete